MPSDFYIAAITPWQKWLKEETVYLAYGSGGRLHDGGGWGSQQLATVWKIETTFQPQDWSQDREEEMKW